MEIIEVKKFIFENLLGIGNSDDFTLNDNLLELGLDSLKMMRLIAFIEEAFSISIPDVEVTPNQLVNLTAIKKLIDRQRS